MSVNEKAKKPNKEVEKSTTVEEFYRIFRFYPAEEHIKDGIVMCYNCGKHPAKVSASNIGHCSVCTKKSDDWFKKHPEYKSKPLTEEQRMENMSPEEVLSGVHRGGELSFEKKSTRNWSEEHRDQVAEFKGLFK